MASANEAFPAQVFLILGIVVAGLLHYGADTEVAVLQFSGGVFLVDTRDVDVQLIPLVALLDVRVHHAPQGWKVRLDSNRKPPPWLVRCRHRLNLT